MPIPQLSQQVHSPKNWKGKKKKRKVKAAANFSKKSKKPSNGSFKEKLLKKAILAGVVLFVAGAVGALGFFVWTSRSLPDPDRLNERVLEESTKIFDRTGEHLLYEIHGDTKRTLIELDELPPYVPKAFIAVEDKGFYKHKGVSIIAILRTAYTNIIRGQSAGGSTLTQQFVKNAILTPEKTYTRKIKEAILSYQIEKKFTKDEILQLYFNEIPFGSIAYGIEAASQTYFAKSARELTIAEAATLAAMIQSPTYYSPFGSHVDILLARKDFALGEMYEEGYITDEEFQQAKEQELVFQRQLEDIEAPHFVMYVKEQLVEQFGERLVEQGGLQVITTLDWDKQLAAEKAIADRAETNQTNWEATNAALVSMDTKTGQILAMVGSKDFFDTEIDGQVNVALRPRQPGSSFKPIVYAAAFSRGYVPQTLVYDVVTTFSTETGKDYSPRNYDLSEPGPVSLRKALQGSLNISAVKTLYLTGVSYALDYADKLGYSTFGDRSRFGLSLVLGGGEVTLLEHVRAYATFAREGTRPPIVSILQVTDSKNKELFTYEEQEGEKVLETNPIRTLNNVLSDDNARSYVFGLGSLLTLPGRPVAAKTGTTNDYRDAWTIGYTPSIATGVWVGNNNNSEMKRGASGYTVATPIWNAYMREATKDEPVEQFQSPAPDTITKPMLGGTEGGGQTVKIDTLSGKLATEFTPIHLIEEKTFKNIHSILYYVDRNDPRGPIPSNPNQDPQYANWEAGIADWAERNEITLTETPPTEFDDVHKPEYTPSIAIISPGNNSPLTNSISVTIQWNTFQTFKDITFFINDTPVSTLTNYSNNGQVTTNLNLNSIPEANQYILKAVVQDIYENSDFDYIYLQNQ